MLSNLRPPHAARLATSLFQRTFVGSRPVAAASAPGRVNLIGEHLDYNGGPVLPAALNRRTAVVVGPSSSWQFASGLEDRIHRRDIDGPMAKHWTDYLVGVVRELQPLGLGFSGARIAVATSLPVGAGLSSSAALTVAAAKALSVLAGKQLTAEQLVEVAYRAEHDQVGVRCGRMDQTIAAFAKSGTALLFETDTGERRHVPLLHTIWIVETGRSHRLTGGELNQRRAECEEALLRCRARWPELGTLAELPPEALPTVAALLPEPLLRRVRHVVTEVARTYAAADALLSDDPEELGRLLLGGHASLREDYESSVPEADLVVETAIRHGAYGARLTGAGWGGAVLVLAPPAAEPAVVAGIASAFAARFGHKPVIWGSRAAAGVKREEIRA